MTLNGKKTYQGYFILSWHYSKLRRLEFKIINLIPNNFIHLYSVSFKHFNPWKKHSGLMPLSLV